jgi:hypothetical protein
MLMAATNLTIYLVKFCISDSREVSFAFLTSARSETFQFWRDGSRDSDP